MKFYLVIRPSMKGTSIPMYNYTFAKDEEEAIYKVRMKWGEYDNDIKAREITPDKMESIVIGTNYFG